MLLRERFVRQEVVLVSLYKSEASSHFHVFGSMGSDCRHIWCPLCTCVCISVLLYLSVCPRQDLCCSCRDTPEGGAF